MLYNVIGDIMKSFLSIFVERFGPFSSSRSDLIIMPNLKDIDFCTKLFKNSKELRSYFTKEIEEFKKVHENELARWHLMHQGKTNNGKIYANYIENVDGKNFIATIPIMYMNDEIIPYDEAINHLVYYLNQDDIFKKLLDEKSYLLLEDEDDLEYALAKSYFIEKDIVIKHDVINHLIYRISKMDEDDRYRYFRTLMNMCHLTRHEIFIKEGKITLFSDEIPKETILKECQIGNSYLESLIDDNNDEELYNLYGLEEIENKKEGKRYV